MTITTKVLLNFLQKELQTKNLYYVTEHGWYYPMNIKFLGSFNDCLDFLKMDKEQYKEQLTNFKAHTEGYWYSEILPLDELLKGCLKEIEKMDEGNQKLEICIRDIKYIINDI